MFLRRQIGAMRMWCIATSGLQFQNWFLLSFGSSEFLAFPPSRNRILPSTQTDTEAEKDLNQAIEIPHPRSKSDEERWSVAAVGRACTHFKCGDPFATRRWDKTFLRGIKGEDARLNQHIEHRTLEGFPLQG